MKVIENRICLFLVTYNRKKYLRYALESVLNQTYWDFKITILDNCSTDGTEEYVKSIKDERIRYIKHEKNIGGAGNFSYAFKNCDGDYFAIFHDDDVLHPQLLEKEISYLNEHIECVAVSCLANKIDENGNYILKTKQSEGKTRVFSGQQFFKEYIHNQKHFIFPTTLYRTKFIKDKEIMIKSSPGPCADVVLYMDLEKAGGTIAEIPSTLIDYRIYKNQDSSSHLEEMLVKLINYLYSDNYYSSILHGDLCGRKKYLKWYFRRLLAREASGCISYNNASGYLSDMNKALKSPGVRIGIYQFVLKILDSMSFLSNFAYKVVKKVRNIK